ncbi:MAG: ureidoglycolate lyase [Cytophagales bacterium]
MKVATAPDYLNPTIPHGLPTHPMPLIKATSETLQDYGTVVYDHPESFEIEIVRWPAQGWRPVDEDSGNEGGVTKGIFSSAWRGEVLYGHNAAVNGSYILGYSNLPELASENTPGNPSRILLWHANYHPDGGQLFFPLQQQPFVVPLAKPGDDVKPEDFVAFWFDGTCGLYIHPNVWHEGVFAVQGSMRFLDRQGAVHARVSVDFAKEFNCLLEVPLSPR